MTPIIINLLAEEQQAHEAQARDPLKIAVLIAVVVVGLTVAASATVQVFAGQRKAEADALQQKWSAVEAAQTSAGESFFVIKALADDILAVNQTRTLLAPELALLKDVIPDNIQLTTLRFAVAKETQQPELPPPAAKDEAPVVRRRAAARVSEKLVLHLEGKAFGARPEMTVNEFIKGLGEQPAFTARVDRVQLRSIARGAAGPDDPTGNSLAVFVVECQYRERK